MTAMETMAATAAKAVTTAPVTAAAPVATTAATADQDQWTATQCQLLGAADICWLRQRARD